MLGIFTYEDLAVTETAYGQIWPFNFFGLGNPDRGWRKRPRSRILCAAQIPCIMQTGLIDRTRIILSSKIKQNRVVLFTAHGVFNTNILRVVRGHSNNTWLFFGTFLTPSLGDILLFFNNCFLSVLHTELWNELKVRCLLNPNRALSTMTFCC